jgi:hypothetical protein
MNIDLLKRHTPTGDLIQEWLKGGWYRIVKYDLPPDELSWYLVQVGWFGAIYGVPGSDRGVPWEYNYQLTNAANPISLINSLTEVARHHLKPTRIEKRGCDPLPRTKIIDEIDINATIRALLRSKPNTPFDELCGLVKRPTKTHFL